MKKNLFRLAIMFTFVFVLSRIQMGSGKVYLGQNGMTTTNIAEALQFGTVGEAYNVQTSSKDEWEIENIK